MTFQSNIKRTSSYQSIAKDSRVLSANPYDLIAVLFSELRENLDLMIESAKRKDNGKMFEFRAKALTILNGLDESLNFEDAGELAQTLHTIYVEAAKRIQAKVGPSLIERVESARELLYEIEKAWMAIAPARK
ncbi:MAG: hypothetical protein Pars2KO_00220 [Parasphingorhabdus sp.]